MKRVFAPWRLDYIVGPREEGCVFCKKPLEEGRERENLILYGGQLSFVMLNRYPYTAGHLMVIPKRHTADFSNLSEGENSEIARLLQRSVAVLKRIYRPEGFNIGINLARAAGAGIRDHLHWHVVPRWVGDTNFFPVLSDTRSIPQALESAWDALAPAFRENKNA